MGTDLIASALALNQVVWQRVEMLGPAIGGIVIARWGFGVAYAIDLVTYGAMFIAAFLMRPCRRPRTPRSGAVGGGR